MSDCGTNDIKVIAAIVKLTNVERHVLPSTVADRLPSGRFFELEMNEAFAKMAVLRLEEEVLVDR